MVGTERVSDFLPFACPFANTPPSPVISTEWYFVVFDGVMVVLAFYAFNVAHPGMLLRRQAEQSSMRTKDVESSGSSTTTMRLGSRVSDSRVSVPRV
jgi:hypothetical protein